MALINCPECNKEISDQSEKCIYCGYPLQNILIKNKNMICKINGITYDFSQDYIEAEQNKKHGYKPSLALAIRKKADIHGHDAFELEKIIWKEGEFPLEFEANTPVEDNNNDIHPERNKTPLCPYCKSKDTTKIGTVKRSVSFGLFGFGSGKVGKQWHCNSCKSDF